MKANSFSRRHTKLEDSDQEQDTITFAYRWLNENDMPETDWIERRIPSSHMFKFEWIDKK